MSCGSATCSPTISYSLPIPALPFARPGFFAIPARERLRAAMDAVARPPARREARKSFWQ
jgi:hypothetical protein